jgi:hypothetical protein
MKKTSSVDIELDLKSEPMIAKVSGHIVEKYARKLLQTKLRDETQLDGWVCWGRDTDENGDYCYEVQNGQFLFFKMTKAMYLGNKEHLS